MINIDKLLKELICELESEHKDNFTGLVLFGSYAKGTQTPKSDVDIILTFKKLNCNPQDYTDVVIKTTLEIEDKYKIDINPIVSIESKLAKTPLTLEIADYAKIIVDKNKDIKKLFDSIKQDYKEGFVKKIFRNGYSFIQIIENV